MERGEAIQQIRAGKVIPVEDEAKTLDNKAITKGIKRGRGD